MKVCSVCRKCYEDSVTDCSADDNGSLIQARDGNRLLVEGYELDFRIEPDLPFELYKATHLDSEKSVLIRFVKTKDSSKDLQNEIETVAAINHPNLARVYEFGNVSENEFYVILEDVSDKNLRSFLDQNSPLKERHAIKIARQIAEALEELHSKNVVHRAVSPANIYFTNAENSDFEVKLQNYDFGAVMQKSVVKGANGIDAKTEIFQYYSPEQFSGEDVDFKSDIYSLAVVFYEMLLGHSPYNALNPQVISNYVFNESDTEKLHFDLRALLAYTLHQSLQHKLPLRPPTTNNLARQYRHLELVAAPPEIGLQNIKINQPKQRKNISDYQTSKSKLVENKFVEEIKIFEPEIIESEPQDEEQVAAQTEEIKSEISEAKTISELEPIEKNLEPALVSEDLSQSQIQNLNAEVVSNEDAKAGEIEFAKNFEEQSENDSFELIDEFDSVEDKIFSENIHITNPDFVEEIEPELYFSEPIKIAEPEFVEEPTEKVSPADRHIMNSFGAYSQPKSFKINKTYIYTAIVLAFIFFGIFITATISNRQNNETSSSANPPVIPANLNVSEKSKETVDRTDEVLTIEEKRIQGEIETTASNENIIQTDFTTAPNNEGKKSPLSNDEKNAERKIATARTVKKQTKNNLKSGQNKTAAKKSDVEKSKPATNTAAGMTRPRIVTNVKTND